MYRMKVSKKLLRDGWLLCLANDKPKLIAKGLGKKPRAYYYFTYGNDRGYIAFSEHQFGVKATISVAGTDDKQDWKENFQAEMDYMGRHKGFYGPAKEIWEDIIVKHISAWRGVKSIEMRAHSRGGAVCIGMAEFASDMSKDYPWKSNVSGIFYGAPMYGDERWKNRMGSIGKNFLRVEDEFDPVPHVPPTKWGYVKECPVFEVKQMWIWRFLPIRSHLWYGRMIKKISQKVIDKFNNK